MGEFTGFTQSGLNFLQALRQNNNKEWFDENRDIYQEHLLEPMRKLVQDLSQDMVIIDDLFETRPAIGKTISRMHRDTRFSHDKSVYRCNLWLTFKRSRKNWTDAPVYFFEFGQDWWRYGLGYYSASKTTMDLFRQQLLKKPAEFLEMAKCIEPNFTIEGDSYKRPLIKDQDPALAAWYNKKSFALMSFHRDMEPVLSSELVGILRADFLRIAPLYQMLIGIEGMKRNQLPLGEE